MSINHISRDLQETLWWQQQHQQPMKMEPTQDSSSSKPNKTSIPQQYSWPSHLYHHQLWVNSYNSQESASIFSAQNHPTHHTFNLNQEDTVVVEEPDLDDQSTTDANQEPDQDGQLDKEPMFEKPLTPSDVGKLNRLVIPKQHAEKHFPLGGESGDKGLLLSFEDESGKCWRFRYSYWTSSQSYVLTKGWSRYVKEKRLDAGDVIQFERHRRDSERVFIGWRRRGGGSGGCNRGLYSSTNHPYPLVDVQNHDAGSVVVENQAIPVGNSKRLRLFGVNLECQLDESEPQATHPHHHRHHDFYSHTHHPPSYSSNRHTHMDITFSQDVNQMMRNRQG